MSCNKAEQGQSEKKSQLEMIQKRKGSSLVKGGNSPHPSFLNREFLSRWDFLLLIRSEMHPNSYTITTSFPIKAKKTLCSLTDCCKQTDLSLPLQTKIPAHISVCPIKHALCLAFVYGWQRSFSNSSGTGNQEAPDSHAPEPRFPSPTMHSSLQAGFSSSVF